MSMALNSSYINEAKECVDKWSSRTKLLNDITSKNGYSKWDRYNIATLLENQRLWNEQATDTADIAQFKRISIPLVRRIYPQLIANKIVSVQPLLGPTGLVYYMRFRYASNKGATRGQTQPGFPTDDGLSLMQDAAGNAQLDIWFTHQYVSQESQTNAGGAANLQYQLEHTPVLPGTVTGSIYDGGTLVYNFVVSSAGAFTLTAVGTPSVTITAGNCSLNHVTGVMTLAWASDPGTNNVVVNYEYNFEAQQDLPEVNLVVESEDITAVTRKLKAVWTYEAQQDLRSQHNLDAEQEITSVLAQEINLEIDREILLDLRNNAGTVAAWDYNTTLGDTIKEKYESLFIKLTEISNVIHRKTLRGGANWLVMSPEVASIIECATAGFAPIPSDNFTMGAGIQYVGAVAKKWQIFKDPLFQVNQILMGYKGESYMDSGYFFCPYVPLTQTPTVVDPDGFTPRKGLITRYGKKMLREGAKFYGRLSIANYVI